MLREHGHFNDNGNQNNNNADIIDDNGSQNLQIKFGHFRSNEKKLQVEMD